MDVPIFQVSADAQADEVRLALTGELDLAGESVLEEAIQRARETGRALTIDLSGLDFIDSSGLRVLVRFHKLSEREGFSYTLIPGRPQVHRPFVLCGLDVTLPFAAPSR